MKKIQILSAIVLAAAAIGCDDIKESDRYIPLEEVKPVRTVLIEEFTGQRCQNCPEGHRMLESLKKQYGDSVIPVSIHAVNSLSIPVMPGTNQGLKTEDGDIYYNRAGAEKLPSAVIDRRGGVLDLAQWSGAVREELKKDTPVKITISASYDNVSNQITADIDMKSTTPVNCTLQVWLTEDGIVSYQLNGSEGIRDYVHNHVYRATMNTVDGESVTINDTLNKNYFIEANSLWVPANMTAVAFVFDNSGVLQAASAPVSVAMAE